MDVIVTTTPTIQSGAVVRWYMDMYDAHNYLEFMSASREKVTVRDATISNPREMLFLVDMIESAVEVMDDLRAGKDVSELATHRRSFGGRDLVEIQ